MRPLIALALALTALGGAACSGGDDDADPTTTAPSTTIASTDPTVESTEPDPTTTTAPSTTSTIPAPTTTIDPTDALIADIEADLNAGEQAFLAAGADPSNPALRADLQQYYSGNSLAAISDILDGFVNDGLVVRPSSDGPSFLEVLAIEEVDQPPTNVIALLCRVDRAVVYAPLGASEGIVDDQIYNTTSRSRIIRADDVWRLDGGTNIEDRLGVTTCE